MDALLGHDILATETYPAGGGTVFDTKVLTDSSFVYCGATPDLGRIDQRRRVIFVRTGEIYKYNQMQEDLRINADGTEVGFTPRGKQPLTFDVNKGRLG